MIKTSRFTHAAAGGAHRTGTWHLICALLWVDEAAQPAILTAVLDNGVWTKTAQGKCSDAAGHAFEPERSRSYEMGAKLKAGEALSATVKLGADINYVGSHLGETGVPSFGLPDYTLVNVLAEYAPLARLKFAVNSITCSTKCTTPAHMHGCGWQQVRHAVISSRRVIGSDAAVVTSEVRQGAVTVV